MIAVAVAAATKPETLLRAISRSFSGGGIRSNCTRMSSTNTGSTAASSSFASTLADGKRTARRLAASMTALPPTASKPTSSTRVSFAVLIASRPNVHSPGRPRYREPVKVCLAPCSTAPAITRAAGFSSLYQNSSR